MKEASRVISLIERRFPVKRWGFLGTETLQFCGKDIGMFRDSNGVGVIKVSMGPKPDGLEELVLDNDGSELDALSKGELRRWQSTYGSLLWLSAYRADIGFLMRWSAPHGCKKDALRVKDVIKFLRGAQKEVCCFRMSIKKPKILIRCDAAMQLQSHLNSRTKELETGKPVGGYVFGLIDESVDVVTQQSFAWHVIAFASFRVERRCFSSYSAEIEAAVVTVQRAELLVAMRGMLFDSTMCIELGSDSLSMIRRINSRSGVRLRDSENATSLLFLKDRFRANGFHLHHLPDEDNCSDGLTKSVAGKKKDAVRTLMATGMYCRSGIVKEAITKDGDRRIKFEGSTQGLASNHYSWCEERDGALWKDAVVPKNQSKQDTIFI